MTPMLEGKIALVTGASRGLGEAIARELASAGAKVVGTATTAAGAEKISRELEASGGRGIELNVGDPASIEAALKLIQDEVGPIGILVNNAGVTRDNLILRMKDEEWEELMAVNLTSVFRLSRAVIRSMVKARAGRIINVGSVVGSMGNAGQSNYAAAKAGLVGFSKSLAREVGSRGITVNCVAPGFIDTDMTKALPEAQREALLGQIPLGRLGRAAEIAAAVLFLASPGAAYITGTTLHVNGGMYMD